MRSVLYVLVFLLSATAAAYLHYLVLNESDSSRSANFIASFTAMLLIAIAGGMAEEKWVWRDFFGARGRDSRHPLTYRRLAPPPVSMGVAAGLLVFLVWS